MSNQNLKRKKVYIDALPIALPNLSGIGHVVWNIVGELDKDQDFLSRHELVLIASKRGMPQLKSLGLKNVSYKQWPIKPKIINGLNYFDILPPVDLFMGRGIYIFANYTTWPLALSKSITFVYDIGFERYPEFAKPSVYRMLHKNLPKWIKRTSKILTVSNFSKSEIQDFYHTSPDKIDVMYCGVDTKLFYPQGKDEIKRVGEKYGLDKPYVFFLSNLEPRKNLERIVKAFELLPKDLRDKHTLFLVGGDGWQDEAIQEAIKTAISHGCDIRKPKEYVPDKDLPGLLSGADILAHPAAYEGFGVPPLEAMACGTPVLASKRGSLPEVLGDAALYADYKDVNDIASKMNILLTDQSIRKKLREKGLKRSQQFSWGNGLNILKNLIIELEDTRS